MRIPALVTVAFAVLVFSGCSARRTCRTPMIQSLYVQPKENVKRFIRRWEKRDAAPTPSPCATGGCGSVSGCGTGCNEGTGCQGCQSGQSLQSSTVRSNPLGVQPGYGSSQMPGVVNIDNCGCQPGEVFENINWSNNPGIEAVEEYVDPPMLELEPPQQGFEVDAPTIEGFPSTGYIKSKNLKDISNKVTGQLEINDGTSRFVEPATEPFVEPEAPAITEPRTQIKALPVSTEINRDPFELEPAPVGELGPELFEEPATIELPAKSEEKEAGSNRIVLRARTSPWTAAMQSKPKQLDVPIKTPVGPNELRNPNHEVDGSRYYQARNFDVFGQPVRKQIQFSDLPPMDSATAKPVQIPNPESNRRPSEWPRVKMTPTTDDKTTQWQQDPKKFVVESTATYRAPTRKSVLEMHSENDTDRILRLTAFTGSSSKDRNANIASFRMKKAEVVKGSYVADGSANKATRENVSSNDDSYYPTKTKLKTLER